MKNPSLLRYPGGKSSLGETLVQIRKINGLGDTPMVEPFGGGAGAALKLLFLEEAPEIYVNDADPAIFNFWWSVTHRPHAFSELIRRTRVNMSEWRRQRDIYRSSARVSRLRRGFAAFYLNRCNRSGIIMNGGPIGGVKQAGKWKLNARYNKATLLDRCEKISEFNSRIRVSGRDGIDILKSLRNKSPFYFIDPPYYDKGKTLYLNSLDAKYHAALANQLKTMQNDSWIVTYDDCPEIRRLYRGWANIRPFELRYAASVRRDGNEVLISPKWMKLPTHQSSAAINW